jgi:hypothetical protein
MIDVNTRETAFDYAQLIAAELAGDWTAEEAATTWDRASRAFLVTPDGERVLLSFGWAKNRIAATAVFPEALRGVSRDRVREIGFALDKTPAQQALDLTRRLLPSYRDAWRQAWASKRVLDARKAERDALVDQAVATLAPVLEIERGSCGTFYAGSYGQPVEARVEVWEHHGGDGAPEPQAHIDLRVRRDLLPQVTAFLAQLAEQG